MIELISAFSGFFFTLSRFNSHFFLVASQKFKFEGDLGMRSLVNWKELSKLIQWESFHFFLLKSFLLCVCWMKMGKWRWKSCYTGTCWSIDLVLKLALRGDFVVFFVQMWLGLEAGDDGIMLIVYLGNIEIFHIFLKSERLWSGFINLFKKIMRIRLCKNYENF